jgi:hypothetical protein
MHRVMRRASYGITRHAHASYGMRHLTLSMTAELIWLARARCQMSVYTRSCARSSRCATRAGVRHGSVGRIASCASCGHMEAATS